MDNMENTIPVDRKKFYHLPKKFLPLDIPEYYDAIIAKLELLRLNDKLPKVVFLDAIYMMMEGDLILNKEARKFLSKVGYLMDEYHLTVVMVHHESKDQYDKDHKVVRRGDKGSYGSVFFRCNVDHILYLNKKADKTRTLSCETQRSGKVMEREDLILIQPDPLCFEIKGDYSATEETVKYHIWNPLDHADKPTRDTLTFVTELSPSAVDKALRHLFQDKQIVKLTGKPVRFMKHPDIKDPKPVLSDIKC